MTQTDRLRALVEKWRAKAQRRYDDAERLRNVEEDERAGKIEARADENRSAADELDAALLAASRALQPEPAVPVTALRELEKLAALIAATEGR